MRDNDHVDAIVASRHTAQARELDQALSPWLRRLTLEGLRRWLVRGATVGLSLASLVLAVGWVLPWPESALRPVALPLAAAIVAAALLAGLRPARTVRRAAALDVRLGLDDRLATAWVNRHATEPMALLQREEALARLAERSPGKELPLGWRQRELANLAGVATIAAVLLLVPSPMEAVLQRQAREQVAVQAAAERVAALRQEVATTTSLTPEQGRRVDELLEQAQVDLAQAANAREAAAILARAEQAVGQLGDPSAEAHQGALAAMSETLDQEPLARPLARALQGADAPATDAALRALADPSQQPAPQQRQALARALQRAANVGRSDARSAGALQEAAHALSAGEPAGASLQAAADGLRAAVESANAQAELGSTTRSLQDLRSGLQPGAQTGREGPPAGSQENAQSQAGSDGAQASASSASGPSQQDAAADELSTGAAAARGQQAGVGSAALSGGPAAPIAHEASEDVFVPGRAAAGPGDQEAAQQPPAPSGQPRPYREALSQYTQSEREYVERADVPPNVRELVKQYFADLAGS